jgi:hypothetical protein|tara:strand:+ start:114 stop:347 length:234 start_codon:yes stop_codon:yes gene_type:complete
MEYTYSDIEKITEFKTWSERQKLDELLRIDCKMYTNLGIDSTKKEASDVRVKSKKIYKLIKTINPTMGTTFLNAMDS